MLTEYFQEILENYLDSTRVGRFNKNHEMFRLINYTAADALNKIVKEFGLTARGSCGAGVWTKYPWLAVYNPQITTSIQKGVYIVYLFAQDMSRVYLTLNQGCTILKRELGTKAGRESMITTRKMVRELLNNTKFNEDNNLSIGNLDYEIGSIYYKEYLKQDFPNEQEFLEDLYEMISIYNDYYELTFKEKTGIPKKNQTTNNGEFSMKSNIEAIGKFIKSKGYIFSYEDLCNFYLSLKTKPFVILAGISGTGKSKLVKLFSEAIGATSMNNRYNILSVKPDWNDSTELFGYKNINDEFIPGQLTRIIKEASKSENIDKPYFVCLDEMNLSRVEYYLSEYLSIIESRDFNDEGLLITDRIFPRGYLAEDNPYSDLGFPENIYIIGTVNMDDTTFAFSRKVLDRANTLEFSEVNLEELNFDTDFKTSKPLSLENDCFKTRFISIKDAVNYDRDYVTRINNWIVEINNILTAGNKHFGYRVRDEIVFYMLENKIHGLMDESVAFDYQIMQKILPTITGSGRVIKEILIDLYNYCNPDGQISDQMDYIKYGEENLETALFIKSASKILMMLRGYEDGFVSFWI
jgi:5-methylcytosine-specific restriction protein B